MLTGKFLTAALERAVKTFAQTLAAALAVGGLDLLSVPWGAALSTAGLAALLSLLTSVVSAPAAGDGPALFGPETVEPSAPAGPSDLS